MIYLASPYSHPDPLVREQRFIAAMEQTHRLMGEGHMVFSPIVHSHPIAVHCGSPTDFNFWGEWNRVMLSAARAFWILQLPGWTESIGVQAETELARRLNKPVSLIMPMRTVR